MTAHIEAPRQQRRWACVLAGSLLIGAFLPMLDGLPARAATPRICISTKTVDGGSDFFERRWRQSVANHCGHSFRIQVGYTSFYGDQIKTGWTACKTLGGASTLTYRWSRNNFTGNGDAPTGKWRVC